MQPNTPERRATSKLVSIAGRRRPCQAAGSPELRSLGLVRSASFTAGGDRSHMPRGTFFCINISISGMGLLS